MPRQRAEQGIEAFTSAASTYEAWFTSPLGAFVDQQERQALAQVLRDVARGTVLDVGAGTGHGATWFATQGHRVTAVEPSAAMRCEGRRRTAGLPIEWCDAHAESLPFHDASFTGAVLFTTLEFVQRPARALAEARRVVCPGGWVVVGWLHALSPWAALYRYQADRGAMPWTAAQFFTREDVERLMGAPADMTASAVHLAPQAVAPFAEAERAGQRAGNQPALEIVRWNTRR
jgi:ubiquinone/menaquinone biosynthesis C-methylase UbiE